MRTDTSLGGHNIVEFRKKHGSTPLRLQLRRDYEIRTARGSDLAALWQIERRCFPTDHFSRQSLARHIRSPRACVIVAERKGAIIGFSLVLFAKGRSFGRLMSLAVNRQARGGGLGASLLQAAELAAARFGVKGIQLETRRHRAKFYTARGYAPVSLLARYYADGGSAMRLRKRLTGSGETVVPFHVRG
jgi:[ribosomal protein S18]-alanine N-acetyltransferase